LSLVTVGGKKQPNFSWTIRQTEPYKKTDFERDYNYSGGKFKKNGDEILPTEGIGIVTGYNGLEVVDVDLKVLPSLKEQQDFWTEYLSFLEDNIADFDKKFVIYKTVNNGYHILYRCSKIEGNLKIAKLKGQKEAIIETRGIGGYVFIYENKVSKADYTQIKEVSELDREMLLEVSRFYNYEEEKVKVEPEKKPIKDQVEVELSVWDDYNSRVSIFDVINDDFDTVRQLAKMYVIKRHGAESAHSGYVYKDSMCMFLFTTGTIYPHEKLISPFVAYAYKNHSGNFSEAAKVLYQNGYGSRIVKKVKELEKKVKTVVRVDKFPIEIFPLEIQNYILNCYSTLDSSIDYMGCSMLWLLSVILGNSLKVQVKKGWVETAVTWISIVGKAGIGKTPSLKHVLFPLLKANDREIKVYMKNYAKYDEYMALDKDAKNNTEKIKKPNKTQFIVDDITLEALFDLHEENKNAVGIFKDELAGWLKDMNKYRDGSDMQTWLTSWSGTSVTLNRKTSKSSFVQQPLIPVLGGIQPGILESFYTDENKDNGFIDRMLLCFPDLRVEKYNRNQLSDEIYEWYNDYIISFYDYFKNKVLNYAEDGDINPYIATLSPDAEVEWERIFNEITDWQNGDDENEYMKSMLPKQKSYIPRFALMLNTFHAFHKQLPFEYFTIISKESMLKAEKLSKYFIAMAKKIKVNTTEVNDMKNLIKGSTASQFEKFKSMFEADPEINKTMAAELLGVSRKTIYEYVSKLKKV